MSALDDVLEAIEHDSKDASARGRMAFSEAFAVDVCKAREELELLRENAFSLAHAMLTRDIGVCTSCGIPLSGVHSHREQTGCSFVRVIRTDPDRAKRMGLGWAL